MPESTISPQPIEIDTIKGGIARLLIHWNVTQTEREGLTLYQYEEAVIKWVLPDTYEQDGVPTAIVSRADVENYVSANAEEIMSFAKATKLTL